MASMFCPSPARRLTYERIPCRPCTRCIEMIRHKCTITSLSLVIHRVDLVHVQIPSAGRNLLVTATPSAKLVTILSHHRIPQYH